ncbi:hypothetical protein Xen7305DRAFT_00000810 [Xenococcus sp. PCC 7305]|uniref:hypothetical protein n=1 Tax=Xenococcus sp. PCC 7305 TaxID=102125 RepID=UPI0002ACAF7F|nr:hypothetical protein [Xenococcus sp. PCC 7305]ELS00381.1 hypothetical protein Xen7305DRAFT_00000810 [Xenococcus sp. PCC 7305]
MSDSSSWQRSSVQKFFSQSNWEGGHQTKDVDEIFQDISWLCLKIEDFFSQSNWQGKLLTEVRRPFLKFSVKLSVSDFFQCFVWEGNSEIAALPELKSIPEPDSLGDDGMTLDDLSELF